MFAGHNMLCPYEAKTKGPPEKRGGRHRGKGENAVERVADGQDHAKYVRRASAAADAPTKRRQTVRSYLVGADRESMEAPRIRRVERSCMKATTCRFSRFQLGARLKSGRGGEGAS